LLCLVETFDLSLIDVRFLACALCGAQTQQQLMSTWQAEARGAMRRALVGQFRALARGALHIWAQAPCRRGDQREETVQFLWEFKISAAMAHEVHPLLLLLLRHWRSMCTGHTLQWLHHEGHHRQHRFHRLTSFHLVASRRRRRRHHRRAVQRRHDKHKRLATSHRRVPLPPLPLLLLPLPQRLAMHTRLFQECFR
jgi:hypothetical protein